MILLVLLTGLSTWTTVGKAQEPSENLRLRAEILKLKTEVAQKDATIKNLQTYLQIFQGALTNNPENQARSLELTAEQAKLETEFRALLKPKENEVFNWTTLKYEKPKDTPASGSAP